jgi:uncharacterized membrane protein
VPCGYDSTMISKLKTKVVGWVIGRGVDNFLKEQKVDRQSRLRVTGKVKGAVKNIMQGKQTMKNEPVLLGGIITVAVALASAFGLDLTTDQLAITISTLVAVVSFIQRKFVTPTHKEK